MSPLADPSTVLCARLFDNVAITDNHPLARVRYGQRGQVTGWTHVRHDDLIKATGHGFGYWRRLNDYAVAMVAHIAELVAAGALPAITDFAELHDHGDPNTGWGEEIDNLDTEAWAHTQWLVTDLLRFPASKGADQ
jgi:hypothetical protein